MLSIEDIRALKRANPLADVASRCGVELRRSGSSFTGRCPFHHDQGRPNLSVCCFADASEDFFHCFRCGAGGDVIRFVRLLDNLSFPEAVARLQGTASIQPRARPAIAVRRVRHTPRWGVVERACLAAAVTLYHHSLLDNATALGYLRERGIDRGTIERCRVGYAVGSELARYLAWRRLPFGAAVRVGLLKPGGRETFAGRVVVPEIRAARPIWLIGRIVGEPVGDRPKYLGLAGRGRKPLLGWESAVGESCPIVVESVFDWLTLRNWGMGGLALLGTRVRPRVLSALARFQHFYLALNSDHAGREAAELLLDTFGDRAIPVELPGVKDVSELAPLPDGRARFLRALNPWPVRAAA
jgi:DNA primase